MASCDAKVRDGEERKKARLNVGTDQGFRIRVRIRVRVRVSVKCCSC